MTDTTGFGQYLEAQTGLILSNRVLEPAVAKLLRESGLSSLELPCHQKLHRPKANIAGD